VAHSESGMGLLINKLDDFINDFIPHSNEKALTRKQGSKQSTSVYFDKLLTDVFKDIGQYSPYKKDAGNISEKKTDEIYEECFVAAWDRYNTQLEQERTRYNEIYTEAELNAPIFSALETRKILLERRLRYDPYKLLELMLNELKQKGIIPKGYYRSAQGDRRLEMPQRMDIETLLNSAYKNIDKYKYLYKDEFICQDDKDDIAEYIVIFDELNPKRETPAKMKEKENYKYKKFFREIYLACLGLGGKGVGIIKSLTKEQLLEVKWLFPYCYKFLVSREKDVHESIFKEFVHEVESKDISEEHLDFLERKAHETLCKYRGLTKYLLFLFILYDFMTKIRKGEPNSDLFLPIIESSVEDKIRAIGLSKDEHEGLYDYRTMDYFESELDWRNILSNDNYLKFYELKEDTIRSGPFKAYYSDLKKGADRIIEIITDFDGNDLIYDLRLLNEVIEPEATVFINEIYIEGELAKSRKYYEHKNRSQFVGDKIRSIMGGLFRDIAMKEMNLKE